MLYLSIFLSSMFIGALFAYLKKRHKKKRAKFLQKKELENLQKKFNDEIDKILQEPKAKTLFFEKNKEIVFLQKAKELEIDIDLALVYYNKLSFLQENN